MNTKKVFKATGKVAFLPFILAYRDIANALSGAKNRFRFTVRSTTEMFINALDGKYAKREIMNQMTDGRVKQLLAINVVEAGLWVISMSLFLYLATSKGITSAYIPYVAVSTLLAAAVRDAHRLSGEVTDRRTERDTALA